MATLLLDNGISLNECESIIEQYKDLELGNGEAGEHPGNEKLRACQIHWVREHGILSRSLFQFLLEANDTKFRYSVFNYQRSVGSDVPQFTKYNKGGFYDWHKDSVPTNPDRTDRKITLVANLSDPESYDGGDLEFFNGPAKPDAPSKRQQGSVICFDSRDWHRVCPVTRGVRYSLVLWLWGPAFV